MYLGFNLLTFACILFTMNIVVLIMGLYSMIVYHYIILGEEKYLRIRFGNGYDEYMKKVRRYL